MNNIGPNEVCTFCCLPLTPIIRTVGSTSRVLCRQSLRRLDKKYVLFLTEESWRSGFCRSASIRSSRGGRPEKVLSANLRTTTPSIASTMACVNGAFEWRGGLLTAISDRSPRWKTSTRTASCRLRRRKRSVWTGWRSRRTRRRCSGAGSGRPGCRIGTAPARAPRGAGRRENWPVSWVDLAWLRATYQLSPGLGLGFG